MKFVIVLLLGGCIGYAVHRPPQLVKPHWNNPDLDWKIAPVMERNSQDHYESFYCPTRWTLVVEDGMCHENFAFAYK